MVKSKFSLSLIIFTLLLPSATSEIEINANAISISYGAPGYVFVVAGDNVTFNATGIGNASSILWDFERDISGPDTRYSNLINVSHVVHATGVYNITFTAFYDEEYVIKELSLIVTFEEEYQKDIVHNEALFFAIAGSELIMSAVLGYWTHQLRKDKVYL